MYKNLSAFGLGVSGRQSELIELALTNGYHGIDIDIERFVRQVKQGSIEQARRYLDSAVKYVSDFAVGGWNLPTRLGADDATYKADLAKLTETAELAAQVGALRCRAIIEPAHDSLAYHENFEKHRERLAEVASTLDSHQIRLGLDFQAAAVHRQGKPHEFVHRAEELLALMQAVSGSNIGLVLDTWNWHVGGGAMDQIREIGIDKLVAVRVADIPADADLSTIGPQDRMLPCEEGLFDHNGLAVWLNESGYDGPVSPDPHVGQFSGKTRDQIVSLGAKALETMWIAAGLSEPVAEVSPESNGEAVAETVDTGSEAAEGTEAAEAAEESAPAT